MSCHSSVVTGGVQTGVRAHSSLRPMMAKADKRELRETLEKLLRHVRNWMPKMRES